MDETLLGMLIEVRLLQSLNANSPIVVTLLGMLIEVRPLLRKAPLPMDVTLLGMPIEVRLLQQ